MEKVLLEIIQNSESPVWISTPIISEIVESVLIETGVKIYFKNALYGYLTERDQWRERKLKNTFEVWVMQDITSLQEKDLKKLQALKDSFGI